MATACCSGICAASTPSAGTASRILSREVPCLPWRGFWSQTPLGSSGLHHVPYAASPSTDVAHTEVTDHRIPRRPQNLSATAAKSEADHDLPRRESGGRDHRRARHLAQGARPRTLYARARRQDPEGRAAHRRPGRARCLDHRAQALRHDELWRGRGGGDPARPRRLSDVPADGGEPEAPRARPSRLAVLGGDLSAQRTRARAGRHLPPDRSRRLVAIHGRRGAAPPPARRPRGRACRRRTTRSTAATSPKRSSPL